MTRVNLVAFENGVGNSRDIVLIAAALRSLGCEVTVTIPSRHARRRRKLGVLRAFCRGRLALARRQQQRGQPPVFDLNVMLEHIWPEELHRARRNVIVPNPEFFDRHDRSLLDSTDTVWAKTRTTLSIFERLGRPAVLVGFDSADRALAGVAAERSFLHVAGKSRMKGTARLLALWRRHPEWPLLTVVQSLARALPPSGAGNIRLETQFLGDEALRQLQNRCAFHVCTSETEGWGHYLAEAESIGAVVLATDAPPMNELVTAERGILLPAAARGHQNLATTFEFDERAFEERVRAALELDEAARVRLGRAAREWFSANKRGFADRLAQALEQL